MKEKKTKKKISKCTLCISACIAIVLTVFFAFQIKAATPSAQIVFYSTGNRDGELTTSQLLEVKTTNFDKAAYLEYTYNNEMQSEYRSNAFFGSDTKYMDEVIYVFSSNRTYEYNNSMKNLQVKTHETKTFTSPFFAWGNGEWGRGDIYVTVKDTNPESSTYGKEAKASTGGLGLPNLSRDMNAGIGTMIKGDTSEIRNIMSTAGTPMLEDAGQFHYIRSHIEKFQEKTIPEGMTIRKEDIYNPSTGDYLDKWYYVTANNSGLATIAITHKRNVKTDIFYNNYNSLLRWDYGHPSGVFDFYVFDHKPTIKPSLKTLTLSDTIQGVTYSLGSESYTCSKDNEEIVFGKNDKDGFLMTGKEYRIEMSKRVNGKNARVMMQASTSDRSYVTLDYNGVQPIGSASSTLTIPYNYQNLSSETISALGYDFKGWNSEPDGSGINYSQDIVDREYLTVYAQWSKRYYEAEVLLNLDNQPYQDATVALYQNGKQMYALAPQVGTNSYKVSGVEYSKYAENDGAYDVYINGADSDEDFIITGAEQNLKLISQAIHCYKARVKLTNDGAIWGNQKVVLNKLGKEYEMTFNATNNQYEYMFIYSTSNPKDGPYAVYVNNKLIQNETIIIEINMSNDVSTNEVTLPFYKAFVDIKKDNVVWSQPTITLRQKEVIKTTMKYNADLKRYETEDIIDFGQNYDVYVEGTNSKENVGKSINVTNSSAEIIYYSVTFKDANKVYNTQNLMSGDTARKPSTPTMDGNTFSYWASKEDGSGTKYFQSGLTTTDAITKTTNIYAIWVTPSLKLGTYVRCTSTGVNNSKGSYYRLGNIAILGFPGASGKTPIRTAEITITKGSGTVSVNTPGSYTITGNNTTKVTIKFANGVSMAAAEDFLKKNVVIAPSTSQRPHGIKVRVFGVTG